MSKARTREMTRAEALTRQVHAHAFLDAAVLVRDLGRDAGIEDRGNTIASLAVLAGIAATDSITGATLRLRSVGEDHGQAVELLSATHVGRPLVASFKRLAAVKSDVQYASNIVTERRAEELMKSAQRLVDAMDKIMRGTD